MESDAHLKRLRAILNPLTEYEALAEALAEAAARAAWIASTESISYQTSF